MRTLRTLFVFPRFNQRPGAFQEMKMLVVKLACFGTKAEIVKEEVINGMRR